MPGLSDEDHSHRDYRLIWEHTQSPSIRHMRDPKVLDRLVRDIVAVFTERRAIWRKWSEEREKFVLSLQAGHCWAPIDDIGTYLNEMPGPILTPVDVEQRLRDQDALWEIPEVDLREWCEAFYLDEESRGTELPAIIHAMQDYVAAEHVRRMNHERDERRRRRDEVQKTKEYLFYSGADCGWTRLGESPDRVCRINGRLYRVEITGTKRRHLHRVTSVADRPGFSIGL